jgi:uncharacterized protein (DUF2147 family)
VNNRRKKTPHPEDLPMIRFSTAAAMAAALTLFGALPAAADIVGTWQRDTGESRVRFAPCGDAICGTVVWLRDPAATKSKVGMRVFSNMKPSGTNQWSGTAFNPEDGQNYTGRITLSGATLSAGGCVMGGMICRTVNFSRAN